MSVCVSELIRFAGCLFAWAEPDGVYAFIQDRLDFFANSQFHLAEADYGNNFSVVWPALIFVALSISTCLRVCRIQSNNYVGSQQASYFLVGKQPLVVRNTRSI